jgi:gp16 family phage-associated protein
MNLRTPESARRWLDENGLTVQAFARQHDLDVWACYQVLSGKRAGRWGKAHNAAVCLGIKAGTAQTRSL